MKKIIYLLLLLMFIPTLVLADSAGPSVMGYDAIVTNKNGAKVNSEKTVIPYNAKIHVYNEYDDNVEVEWNSRKDYIINKKDIAPYREEYIPTDKDIKENTNYYDGALLEKSDKDIIIYEKNGIKLSKGPSTIYKKYDKVVPYKTKVKITYIAGNWYYVNDGEYKGWVSSDDLIAIHNYRDIVLLEETKMFDDNNNFLVMIPAETIFNKDNLYYLSNGSKYLVNYNGQEGFIGVKKGEGYLDNFVYAISSDFLNIIVLKSIGITSLDGKVRTAINSGEVIDKVYYKEITWDGPDEPVCLNKNCYYYVEYKGTKGFVKDESVILFEKDEQPDNIVTTKETKMYNIDLFNYVKKNNEETLNENIKNKFDKGVIPKGTTLSRYTNWWYYNDNHEVVSNLYIVKYKNEFIVVFKDDNNIPDNQDDNEEKEILKPEPVIKKEEKNKTNANEIILFGVIGSVVLALVALVTIKLINKQKNNKNEEKSINDNKDMKEKETVNDNKKQQNNIKKREVTLESEEKEE